MTCSRLLRIVRFNFLLLMAAAVIGWAAASAQTAPATTATTLTPAQQKAEAAKEARQAAAQQAAEKRAAAVQARTAGKTTPATTTSAATTANSASKTATTAAANTARPTTTAGSTSTPATAATAPKTGTAATVGSGTLAWQTRVYSSTGCVHEGNSAVCSFTFTNQGNAATLVAGGEMQGIQLVDDAHVPHKADSAHFLDKYGTQQPRLVVQPGDTGTYVLMFGNVNSQVSSGDFHLRQQIVGGVTFSSASSGTTAGTTTPAKAAAK
jgi:hypothetical protein